MPTPLEILLDPVSLAILAIYMILMIWEAVFPARQLPKIKFWKLRGLTAFAFFFYLSSYLPIFTDPYLEPYRFFDLTRLGAFGGGLVGVLLYEFGVYVWHRALHTSDFLWRTFHQMHHSAERLDTYGAFYFSPMDMIGWTVLGSLCFALIVGLSPQAITVTLLVTTFLGMFQHANINTPRWLGYVIQRPESHTVHHAKGIHKHNYSDLPVFDILFGTFENPKSYKYQTGFYYGASAKVWKMLSFKDLTKEKEESAGKSGLKKVTKTWVLAAFAFLALNCNREDDTAVIPDSVEQGPDPVEEVLLPNLKGVVPTSGPRKTLVTISGTNFGTDASKVSVSFNGKAAEIESVSETEIKTLVPEKAFTGAIKVIVDETELTGPEFTYLVSEVRVSTFAGAQRGLAEGISLTAKFDSPVNIAFDKDGNLYVSDRGNRRIRKITPHREVSTFAGSTRGYEDGDITNAKFNRPEGIAFDKDGNLYLADSGSHTIRKITPEGQVTTLAGDGSRGDSDGTGAEARFNNPMGIAIDSEGFIYVADRDNHRIRKITPEGVVTTLAGDRIGDIDGTGTNARFSDPMGLVIDNQGILYVADTYNHKIKKVTSDGVVTTYTGIDEGYNDGILENARFSYPYHISIGDDGTFYVSDAGRDRIRSISPQGVVATVAGSEEGFDDGLSSEAKFNDPRGMAIDSEGSLYVVDYANHKIRIITKK